MGRIVGGVASPHGPQVTVPWNKWHEYQEKDRNHPQLVFPPSISYEELLDRNAARLESRVNPESFKHAFESARSGVSKICQQLEQLEPDVVLVVGDDQQEQLTDENLPMFCIYKGETVKVVDRSANSAWQVQASHHPGDKVRRAAPQLAEHLIHSLISEDFDVAVSSWLKPKPGLGHAFSFLYKIWPECPVPMLPVMVNTYFPPNQPSPKRCYQLGSAIHRAVESWSGNERVAIFASGGLSHVIVDEGVDLQLLDAIRDKNEKGMVSLPEDRLTRGTSELRNWVVAAAAMEENKATILDYVPAYRSTAGTGTGISFAYWT